MTNDDAVAGRPANAEDPAPEPHRSRHLNRGATALIGVLLALLGFALAAQLRSNSSSDALAGDREDDLARILADQNSRLDRLQDQLGSLQTAKQRLTDSGNDTAAGKQEAQRQADALAVLTGTVPAHGTGVSMTISDPLHRLKAEDLLDVVEELRGSGAEVIQFGSVRVGTSAAFTDDAGAVFLDGTALSTPYTVAAIGQPDTMNTALNIIGGVVDTVRSVGGSVSIQQRALINITAVRPLSTPKYATLAPK